MEKIMVQGVEIGFNDLTKEMQKKLYLQNKEMYSMDVAQSLYSNIRRLIAKDKKSSSSLLDKLFEIETKIYNFSCINNIKVIWKHPNFVKSDEKCNVLANSGNKELMVIVIVGRKELFKSEDWRDRERVVIEETESAQLNKMLRKEIKEYDHIFVKRAIHENPNFRIEEETIKVLFESENWWNRLLAVGKETDSKKLNEMFRKEIEEYDNEDVKKAFWKNVNFKIEEETVKLLFKSKKCENRIIAAKKEKNTLNLNEMLIKEVKGEDNNNVKDAIERNPNFKIQQETIKELFESKNWLNRLWAVGRETDSKKLNEMLIKEIQGYDNLRIKEHIVEKLKFKIEEETIKVLFESENWWNRLIAAQEEKKPSKLDKMLIKEIQGNYDRCVIDAIYRNINFKPVE